MNPWWKPEGTDLLQLWEFKLRNSFIISSWLWKSMGSAAYNDNCLTKVMLCSSGTHIYVVRSWIIQSGIDRCCIVEGWLKTELWFITCVYQFVSNTNHSSSSHPFKALSEFPQVSLTGRNHLFICWNPLLTYWIILQGLVLEVVVLWCRVHAGLAPFTRYTLVCATSQNKALL